MAQNRFPRDDDGPHEPRKKVTDTRTAAQRKRIMRSVRSADTGPELALRRALYAAGIRGWRCNWRRAPGSPDIAWPGRKVAVFVDGAFWHGHPSRFKPGRSGAYWDEKIAANKARDLRNNRDLRADGWTVRRYWDFEISKDPGRVVDEVRDCLKENS